MGRKSEEKSRGIGRLRRVAQAVKRVFSRGHSEEETAEPMHATTLKPARQKRRPQPQVQARPARREADIPLDLIDRTYTPPVTSSKASFRSDGEDHHQDQELIPRVANDRWNDEDHYTNKSGDPRIGTRRRTYEANESAADSRTGQR